MTFFLRKNSIFKPKISDDLSLLIYHAFQIFPISFKIFHIRHLLYSVRTFERIRDTLLLKISGGLMHGPSPPQFFGNRLPTSICLGDRPQSP